MYDAIAFSFFLICSNFSDVFDEDHFVNALADDVKVIKKSFMRYIGLLVSFNNFFNKYIIFKSFNKKII
jgi:hypothetical protein